MKNSIGTIVVLMVAVGCSSLQDTDAEKQMDAIERKVVLPDSSFNLQDYARFYALLPNGDVSVTYQTGPLDMLSIDSAMIEGICADQGATEANCLDDFAKLSSAKPGDRAWLNDHENLPFEYHTGCNLVRFSYNSQTDQLTGPTCGGGELVSTRPLSNR